MLLSRAGLWYAEPDRFDPKANDLGIGLNERFSDYLARLRKAVSGDRLGELLEHPSLVIVGAYRYEENQIQAWLMLLQEAGGRWAGSKEWPSPLPGRRPCSHSPGCPHPRYVQAWCLDCWESQLPYVQRGLISTYREGQEWNGDVREWMEWARKTTRPL